MDARTVPLLLLATCFVLGGAAEAQTVRWFDRTNASITAVDLSERGQFIVDGRVSGLFLHDRNGNLVWGKNLGDISRVAISPDAEHIAVAAGGKILFYTRAGDLLWQYGESGVQFITVDLSRDRVIGGTSGGRVVLVDFSGIPLWSKPSCSGVTGLSFSPDAAQIAVASSGCVYLLDSRGNELVTRTPNGEARTVTGGRDRVAYETRDGTVYSAAVQSASWRLPLVSSPVSMAMAPAGWFLVASGWDLYLVSDGGSIVKVWNSPSAGQTGPIQDAALSPDGSSLVFAVPGNLTVWDDLPAPPASTPPPLPSPSPTAKVVFVCADGTTADNPSLCPRAASPSPSPAPTAASPSPPPGFPTPVLPSPPPGPPISVPVGPIVAAVLGVAGAVLAVRWARKNRESIDRWRLSRRMRRI